MVLHAVVRSLPLFSAIVLLAVAAVQIWRGKFRTWSESFFVSGFFFAGIYALTDFLYFSAATEDTALLAAKLDVSFVTFSVTLLFLFTIVFLGRMKPLYTGLLIPNLLFVTVAWSVMVKGVQSTAWGWKVNYDENLFYLWLAYISFCVVGGVWNLCRTYKIVRGQSKPLDFRILGLASSFAFDLSAGLVTNAYFAYTGTDEFPVFSTLLIVPGMMGLLLVLPVTWDKLVNSIKAWSSQRYDIKAVYLVFSDGTLIASKSVSPDQGVDSDLFSATLDVIQNFMRTSFPMFSGKWLRTIEHGDLRILIERGQYTYLALVLTGEESDLLRRQMKDIITAFESRNRTELVNWRGMARDAKGTDQALETFFASEVLL